MRNRGALGDRLVDRARHRRIDAGLEARIQRRTIERLDRKQPGKFLYLAGSKQFAETDMATEQRAAGSDREDDTVGHLEIEIFPQLIGDRFDPLQEEGLPVMAGIKDPVGLAYPLFLGLFPPSLHDLPLRTRRPNRSRP